MKSGVKGFNLDAWAGLVAPSGTPPEVVAKLNGALRKIIDSPDVQAKFKNVGFEGFSSTPQELGGYIKEQLTAWGKMVGEGGRMSDPVLAGACARECCQTAMHSSRQPVGWVERSDTHHRAARIDDGFRKGSTHPTGYGHRLVRRKTVSHITFHEPSNPQARRLLESLGQKPDRDPARSARTASRSSPATRLRYRVTDDGVLLDKAPANETDDPFAAFSEWSSAADEKAYGGL